MAQLTADRVFDDIGYRKIQENQTSVMYTYDRGYRKKDELSGNLDFEFDFAFIKDVVVFDMKSKQILTFRKISFYGEGKSEPVKDVNDSLTFRVYSPQETEAIYKKTRELGWIDTEEEDKKKTTG